MGVRQSMKPMAIIVAVDETGGFGKDGKIPWHDEEDLKHFKDTTMGHPCIMGRRTYEDILSSSTQPIEEILPGRETYVVTRNQDFDAPGATVVSSILAAVQTLDHEDTREIFILGGEKIFIESLAWVDTVYLTIINGVYGCDRFFPVSSLAKKFNIVDGKQGKNAKFVTYKRK